MDSENILSILASLGQGPDLGITPTTFSPVPDQASIATPTPNIAAPAPNVLQAIAPQPAAPLPPPEPVPKAEPEHPRKRLSVIDTIGRLADVFATVGGAQALYQPTLDSREDRTLALGDHARQVDMDALRKRLAEQQITAGEQAPQEAMRDRLGRALGAIAGNPDAAALWPSVAEQAGITDPQQIAAIGERLAQNPASAEIFAKALGYAPPREGSQSAGVQNYETYQRILSEQGPEAAEQFLKVASPQNFSMSPYQQEQIKNARRVQSWRENPANPANRPNPVKPDKNNSSDGGSDVAAILQDFGIRLDGKQDPVADLIRGSTSGYIENFASMVPGALGKTTPGQENIGRLETIDNALVLSLAGGKLGTGVSNADRDFFKEMSGKISDPNTPANKRLAAWDQIKGRLRGIQQRAQKPKNTQSTVRPKPAIGDVQQGYRYRGGNPANPTSWEKVR